MAKLPITPAHLEAATAMPESPMTPAEVAEAAADVIADQVELHPSDRDEIASAVNSRFQRVGLDVVVPPQDGEEERLARRDAALHNMLRGRASKPGREHAAKVLRKLNLLDD